MLKVTICKGLPGSGKSTWSKKQVDKSNGRIKRISKDDLRSMLDNGHWSKSNEKFILALRDQILFNAVQEGYNVIIDDTNLHPKHEAEIKKLVAGWNTYHNWDVIVDTKFFDRSVEDCIEYDLKRPVSVGEKVIRDMYNQFLRPKPEQIKDIPGLPDAIICDIDGTLAIMKNRGPFDWHKVENDDLNDKIRLVLLSLASSHKIIIFSGRDSVCLRETESWLMCKGVPFDNLYMRPQGDMRKDSIVKKEMFDKYIRGKYNVKFILDDRQQVVDMWRNELGLTCLQVAEGNF